MSEWYQAKEYAWDDRATSFRRVGQIACLLASKFNVRIDRSDPTPERWRQLMPVLREFDTYHDDICPGKEALDELRTFDTLRPVYPAVAPENIGKERHAKMLHRVAYILELGEQHSLVTDTHSLISLRREEALQTAQLLADVASDAVRGQMPFWEKVMPQLNDMSEAACYIDTIMDTRDDVRKGKTTITPDMRMYSSYMKASIAPLARGAVRVGISPLLTEEFVKMSVDRLKNRVRHQEQPYSSLHNL